MHIVYHGIRDAGGRALLYAYNHTAKGAKVPDIVSLADGAWSFIDWGTNNHGSYRTAERICMHLLGLNPDTDSDNSRLRKWVTRVYCTVILLPRVDWHRSHLQVLAVIFPKNRLLRWWWGWKIRRRKV